QLPFHVECKLPVTVSTGDRLQLPVALTMERGDSSTAVVECKVEGPLALRGEGRAEVALTGGRGRLLVEAVAGEPGNAKITVVASAGGFRDEVERTIPVAPRGFRNGGSGGGPVAETAPARFLVSLPADAVAGSGHLHLRVFPSPLASIGAGLQGLLQEPCGCFEQASSSNYPNVM